LREPSVAKRNPHAFTLVELLVVIGIISLLISVLMPALSKARQTAQAAVCASNMRQVSLAVLNYTIDNRGRFPYGGYAPSGFVLPQYSWTDLIDGYLAGKLTQAELDGNVLDPGQGYRSASSYVLPVLVCPSDPCTADAVGNSPPNGGVPHMTYAMNQVIAHGESPYPPAPPPPSVTMSQVKASSRVLLIVESPNPTPARGRIEGAICSTPVLQSWFLYGGATFNYQSVGIPPHAKHVGLHPGDTFNYAYCDGHVERLYPTDSDGFYNSSWERGIVFAAYWNNFIPARGGWALDGNP
jgi:prepilin-type N-terminal cleavage/methylation domain-containing protein/prepilin-type processing-associated H-X9-DG protein